jgi:hypothetical protein
MKMNFNEMKFMEHQNKIKSAYTSKKREFCARSGYPIRNV